MEKPVIRKWIINRLLFTSRAKSLNAEGEGNTVVSDSISAIKVAKQPLRGNFFICMKADMQIKYKWSIIKQVFYGYYGYICCKRMAKKIIFVADAQYCSSPLSKWDIFDIISGEITCHPPLPWGGNVSVYDIKLTWQVQWHLAGCFADVYTNISPNPAVAVYYFMCPSAHFESSSLLLHTWR